MLLPHACSTCHHAPPPPPGCATVAEVRKRGDEFWSEFEFYLSDLLVRLGCAGEPGRGVREGGRRLLLPAMRVWRPPLPHAVLPPSPRCRRWAWCWMWCWSR